MYHRHGGSDSSWRALEGSRFDEERRYYSTMVERDGALPWVWTKAARVARIRFSRAHALTLLPKAALAQRGVKSLAEHVVGFRSIGATSENGDSVESSAESQPKKMTRGHSMILSPVLATYLLNGETVSGGLQAGSLLIKLLLPTVWW